MGSCSTLSELLELPVTVYKCLPWFDVGARASSLYELSTDSIPQPGRSPPEFRFLLSGFMGTWLAFCLPTPPSKAVGLCLLNWRRTSEQKRKRNWRTQNSGKALLFCTSSIIASILLFELAESITTLQTFHARLKWWHYSLQLLNIMLLCCALQGVCCACPGWCAKFLAAGGRTSSCEFVLASLGSCSVVQLEGACIRVWACASLLSYTFLSLCRTFIGCGPFTF